MEIERTPEIMEWYESMKHCVKTCGELGAAESQLYEAIKKAEAEIKPGDLVRGKLYRDAVIFGFAREKTGSLWSTMAIVLGSADEVRKATPEEEKLIRPQLEEKP